MEEGRWPKVVLNDRLCKSKKTWMHQNNKWFSKWGIYLNACPINNKEIKAFVMEKFQNRAWDKELEKKKNTILKCLIPLIVINQKHI